MASQHTKPSFLDRRGGTSLSSINTWRMANEHDQMGTWAHYMEEFLITPSDQVQQLGSHRGHKKLYKEHH